MFQPYTCHDFAAGFTSATWLSCLRTPRSDILRRWSSHPTTPSSAKILPAVRDVPAAALTAFARSEDRTRALRSGFEMHLAKPVDPGELVAAVAMLVRRARSAK